MSDFAKRYGYEPMKMPFQREAVDKDLRTKLWNVLSMGIWDHWEQVNQWHNRAPVSGQIEMLVKRLWVHYFNYDLDDLPDFKELYDQRSAYGVMKSFFFSCPWYLVYTFLEAIAQDRSNLCTPRLREFLNKELEHHNAAYRFVDTSITEITSEHEIGAIESALKSAPEPVREHLASALRMLSDKTNPDYRNSIKESISAVESACRAVAGIPKATLSDALKKIPNLHPALAQGFDKLYGWTSDEGGIRHSLMQQSKNTYGEAKFMLVACSGFVSYLQTAAK